MSNTAIFRLVCVTLILSALLSTPVSAQTSCFTSMARCFENTASIESFWYRVWEALDCELGFICVCPHRGVWSMRNLWLLVVAVGLVPTGCGDRPDRVVLEPDERVIGRARDDTRVRLLITSGRLVTFQLSDLSTTSERVLGLEGDDAPWGLAVSSDGKWWTLAGTSQLAEIDERGQVADRLPLEGRYVGLFSVGDTILVQPAAPAPGEPVLQGLSLETMGDGTPARFALRPSTRELRRSPSTWLPAVPGTEPSCPAGSATVCMWTSVDGRNTAAVPVRSRSRR